MCVPLYPHVLAVSLVLVADKFADAVGGATAQNPDCTGEVAIEIVAELEARKTLLE